MSSTAPPPRDTAGAPRTTRDDTVSPPDAISPSSNPAAAPSRTVVPTHFPHQPPTAAPVHPFLDTALPALNPAPLELDGTPVSSPITAAFIARRASWKPVSVAAAALSTGTGKGAGRANDAELEDDPEAKECAAAARLKAADPAVMVGPPGTPNAEEFEAAKVGEKEGESVA
jgi:hypothetical protein